MIAHIAQAVGAPTPTLVIDARPIPSDEPGLRTVLTTARAWLADHGHEGVLKIALVSPSAHPLFDLDYRFVQALPQGLDQFDFRGSCGHSILSSVLVADTWGWLPSLAPASRVRVRVLNNGDHVVCEVDEARRGAGTFTVHFVQEPDKTLNDLLLTGNPHDPLLTACGVHEASLVATGNPYVFVDATSLGLTSRQALFGAGPDTYACLQQIRVAAATALGWPADSVFPKIAAVGAYEPGRLAVRAISVPTWHPTLALTGATCLAAATAIPDTIPARLLEQAGGGLENIVVDSPHGTTNIAAALDTSTDQPALQWVSVSDKQAHLRGPVRIPELSTYLYQESLSWQPANA
ncbi:PrpF domain-containing protein [Streptomyces sp. NPDC057702]|uniref:PrpF domain-containing protein n=1 Tax=unclassified Streptomyces TaxID=2593676 RepID=UPI0036CD44B2